MNSGVSAYIIAYCPIKHFHISSNGKLLEHFGDIDFEIFWNEKIRYARVLKLDVSVAV